MKAVGEILLQLQSLYGLDFYWKSGHKKQQQPENNGEPGGIAEEVNTTKDYD